MVLPSSQDEALVDSLEKTDSGRDWGQEEKGTTEDEMAGCGRTDAEVETPILWPPDAKS